MDQVPQPPYLQPHYFLFPNDKPPTQTLPVTVRIYPQPGEEQILLLLYVNSSNAQTFNMYLTLIG